MITVADLSAIPGKAELTEGQIIPARIGSSGHYRCSERISGPTALATFASNVVEFFAD